MGTNVMDTKVMDTKTAEDDTQAAGRPQEETAKCRQIIDGARAVFLAQGFDAASMGEIARQAGVSKGTLYVYFDSKEELFAVVAREACKAQAENLLDLNPDDHDVEAVLTRLGQGYARFLNEPGLLSPIRTVISISERMPAIGKMFYETGPAVGVATLRGYLEAQVAAGYLAIDDCEVVAAQFLDSCRATIFKRLLFNTGDLPSEAHITHVVDIAVRAFLAAYRSERKDTAAP
jgi:AcrR family transcriptional regulator